MNFVKLDESCEAGKMKSKLLQTKLTPSGMRSVSLYQERRIGGDGFTHHFEYLPVAFLRPRVCARTWAVKVWMWFILCEAVFWLLVAPMS